MPYSRWSERGSRKKCRIRGSSREPCGIVFQRHIPMPVRKAKLCRGDPFRGFGNIYLFPPPNGTHSGAVLAGRKEVVERNALFAVVRSNLAALIFWNASPTLPTRRCLASSRQTSPHAMRLPPYCDTASFEARRPGVFVNFYNGASEDWDEKGGKNLITSVLRGRNREVSVIPKKKNMTDNSKNILT